MSSRSDNPAPDSPSEDEGYDPTPEEATTAAWVGLIGLAQEKFRLGGNESAGHAILESLKTRIRAHPDSSQGERIEGWASPSLVSKPFTLNIQLYPTKRHDKDVRAILTLLPGETDSSQGEGICTVTTRDGRFAVHDCESLASLLNFLSVLSNEYTVEPVGAHPDSSQGPTEMAVCEIDHLILHADQTYVFRVMPNCEKCAAYVSGDSSRGERRVEQRRERDDGIDARFHRPERETRLVGGVPFPTGKDRRLPGETEE